MGIRGRSSCKVLLALSIVSATKLEGQATVPALVADKALCCLKIGAATGGRPYKLVAETMDEAVLLTLPDLAHTEWA